MIMLRNTYIAYPAMFASGWLDQVAGLANLSRLEENMVVRVLPHMSVVITGVDDGRNGSDRSICHYVLYSNGDKQS